MTSKVKYRYRDEDFQLVDGDEYKISGEYINVSEWQATGEADVIHPDYGYTRTGWFTKQTFTTKQGEIGKGDTEIIYGAKVGEHWQYGGKPCSEAPGLVDEWWVSSSGLVTPRKLGGLSNPTLMHFRHPAYQPDDKTYYFDNPIFTHWHAVDGEREITLTIKLNGTTIFTRTEIEKVPNFLQVIAGYECPENTCPVLCQDTICCYNSQGISIDSFLKEESIY